MTDGRAPERALSGAAHLLARRVGLRLDPAIRGRLWRVVNEEADARRQDVASYVARLDSDPVALQDLLNRVTVQESAFFRDPGQFSALARDVLPALAAPVTVWSAGCANGQEPFSLAMVLAESGCPAWRVLATDISTRALERARRASYSARELAGLSPERRQRFVIPAGSSSEIIPALRARVHVSRHNLVSDPAPCPAGGCHVVFCRNVLIYFNHEEVVSFLERLARWLPPGGWLFLGYSESLWQLTDRFRRVRLGDAFVYRRSEEPGKATLPARPARRQPEPAVAPTSGLIDLMAAGEAAISAGDYEPAVVAFRRAAYLDPDQTVAHLHLGLALEAAGDPTAARRAYAAARETLERCGTAPVEATLEGYDPAELVRLLEDKLDGAQR